MTKCLAIAAALCALCTPPAVAQTRSVLQSALDQYSQRTFHTHTDQRVGAPFNLVDATCANGKPCGWKRKLVLAPISGSDSEGQALFENSPACVRCFHVIVAGGGALDVHLIMQLAHVDARTANALLHGPSKKR